MPLVKDQSSFYEIRSLGICMNIKALNQVKRKRLIILKIFLEYLEFHIVAYWKWCSPKSCFTNYVPRAGYLYCISTLGREIVLDVPGFLQVNGYLIIWALIISTFTFRLVYANLFHFSIEFLCKDLLQKQWVMLMFNF